MAKDAPDGVKLISTTLVVDAEPVLEQPANETPISETEGKVTDSSESYQTLATWTVSTGKSGVLYGVEMDSDNFAKTHFQLTIGGTVKWTNLELQRPLNIHFAAARLAEAATVLLEGKSNDGTSVNIWGHIEGKAVG